MKSARVLVAAVLVGMAGLSGSVTPAFSQSAETPVPARQPMGDFRINFKFPGGTLGDFVTAMRQAAAPRPCNVLVSGTGGQPSIPAFDFQDVTVATAASAAARSDGRHIAMSVVVEGNGSPVYVFEYRTEQSGGGRSLTEVLSLRSLLEAAPMDPEGGNMAFPAQTVLSALQHAAAAAEADAEPALIKFHEESSLVFVRGTPVQIETVRSAYKLLQSDVARRREAYDGPALRRMEADLAKLDVEIKFMQDQLAQQQMVVEHTQQLVDAGAVSVNELAEAKNAALDTRAKLDRLMIDRKQVEVDLTLERGLWEKVEPHAHETDGKAEPAKR